MPTFNVLHDCATIQLTRGLNTLVDADDYPWLAPHSWRAAQVNPSRPYAAARGRVNGLQFMHRVVLAAKSGPIPPGMHTDHRNGDTLDNRRANLRLATPSQNQANGRKSTRNGKATSRFKGVSWCAKLCKWQAHIRRDGRTRGLGYFDSEVEAALAYNQAAMALFGEFARLNDGV